MVPINYPLPLLGLHKLSHSHTKNLNDNLNVTTCSPEATTNISGIVTCIFFLVHGHMYETIFGTFGGHSVT